jgi:histidine triad (HIT) family protein
VHVVPRRKGDGLRGFFWPRTKYPDAATERKVAAAIRGAMAEEGGGQ